MVAGNCLFGTFCSGDVESYGLALRLAAFDSCEPEDHQEALNGDDSLTRLRGPYVNALDTKDVISIREVGYIRDTDKHPGWCV